MPEWLVPSLVAAFGLVVIFWIGLRNTNHQIKRTLTKRKSPTRAEFLDLMATDVSKEASDFNWDRAMPELEFFKQPITLHPDDDLVADLPLDEEDWSMSWPDEWAEQKGFHRTNISDWPPEWPATLRNYGRWLDLSAQY